MLYLLTKKIVERGEIASITAVSSDADISWLVRDRTYVYADLEAAVAEMEKINAKYPQIDAEW